MYKSINTINTFKCRIWSKACMKYKPKATSGVLDVHKIGTN